MQKLVASIVMSSVLLFSPRISSGGFTEIDLSYLSTDTLPPSRLVAEALLNALPRSLSELRDYDRRMRLSGLAPSLQLQYRQSEGTARRFEHISPTTIRETSSESTTFGDQTRIGLNPLDSFVDERVDTSSTFNQFVERRNIAAIPLNDEVVRREFWQVQATWRLSNLIFHPDELRAADVSRTTANYRLQQVERLMPLYRSFVNAVRQMESNPTSRQARESVEDRLVILDRLTDHFISEYAMNRFGELHYLEQRVLQPVDDHPEEPTDPIEPSEIAPRRQQDLRAPVPLRRTDDRFFDTDESEDAFDDESDVFEAERVTDAQVLWEEDEEDEFIDVFFDVIDEEDLDDLLMEFDEDDFELFDDEDEDDWERDREPAF